MQSTGPLLACLFALVASASAAEKSFVVTVEAGDFDRRDTMVEVALPEALKNDASALRLNGKTMPVQHGKNGRTMFVVEQLRKGERVSYELTASRAPGA